MFISGIQQIGIGVADVKESFKWYRKHFGMDVPLFEEAATASLMQSYTGGQPQERHAILAVNLQGGGGMEIWQYTQRTPSLPAFQPQLGDLGIFAAKIKCKDVEACFQDMRSRGVTLVSEPIQRPDGRNHFYVKDPWDNTFELVNSNRWFSRKRPNHTGGIYGCLIGVSDMDRAIEFYREVLGYDQVVYDQTDCFADWQGVAGSSSHYRRVLLGHTEERLGPFSRVIGDTEIELVQALGETHKPRHIFEDRYWGDLGFIHLCFDVSGMEKLKEHCAGLGYPFTVDSRGHFDMGEATGAFAYIEDPDGTLIEFVEAHKIPILKKANLYLHLNRRPNPAKPLPNWMVRALGMARVRD